MPPETVNPRSFGSTVSCVAGPSVALLISHGPMRARPTEIKALVSILEDGEHENATSAVKAMLAHLEEMRIERTGYILVTAPRMGKGLTHAVGPYSTRDEALRGIVKGHGGPFPGERMVPATLRSPGSLEAFREATEAIATSKWCGVCSHPTFAHIDKRWNATLPVKGKQVKPDWRQPGCVCPGCECKERY